MLKTASRIQGLSLFVIVGLVAIGCTKPYLRVETPRPTAAPAAEQARIYFLKPGGSFSKAEVWILENDKVIGYLASRMVFYVDVPAGEHFFMSVTSNTEGLKANLAGGKTYYVRLFSTPGAKSLLIGGSENLYFTPIVPGAEGWDKRYEWIDGAQLVTVNPDYAAKWEAKYKDRNAERLAKFQSGQAEAKILSPEQGE